MCASCAAYATLVVEPVQWKKVVEQLYQLCCVKRGVTFEERGSGL